MSAILLSARQVCAIYGIPEKTLAGFRRRGIGPNYVKLSPGKTGAVRYTRAGVEEWIIESTVRAAA